MMPVTGAIAPLQTRPAGPEPDEIVLWCHLRIYMSVFQALASERGLTANSGGVDALGCAKRTIVMAARSRRALQAMRTVDRAEEIDALVSLLGVLEQEIDERFPGARSFVRLGLDLPVG
jgi:hypothetical protein